MLLGLLGGTAVAAPFVGEFAKGYGTYQGARDFIDPDSSEGNQRFDQRRGDEIDRQRANLEQDLGDIESNLLRMSRTPSEERPIRFLYNVRAQREAQRRDAQRQEAQRQEVLLKKEKEQELDTILRRKAISDKMTGARLSRSDLYPENGGPLHRANLLGGYVGGTLGVDPFGYAVDLPGYYKDSLFGK